MPYKNIVFAKLEVRLFNDHRWYMMSELSQLNYIRLILFAAQTYNKIPKNLDAIKKALKTDQELETIEKSIKEIMQNFPKFKENKHYYYFDDFDKYTNYIPEREIPGKSQGLPKDGTDKIREDKNIYISAFDELWNGYPRRLGRKAALRHFTTSVKTDEDLQNIRKALDNYIKYLKDNKTELQYIKHGSSWFNNWKDWVDYREVKLVDEVENLTKQAEEEYFRGVK